ERELTRACASFSSASSRSTRQDLQARSPFEQQGDAMLRRAAFPLLIALPYAPFCLAAAAHPAPIVLDASVTIVESAQESGPVRRATDDLIADFTKVFGQAPKRVDKVADAGPMAVLIAERSQIPADIHCA